MADAHAHAQAVDELAPDIHADVGALEVIGEASHGRDPAAGAPAPLGLSLDGVDIGESTSRRRFDITEEPEEDAEQAHDTPPG